jgi:Tol biopolymer transport system component
VRGLVAAAAAALAALGAAAATGAPRTDQIAYSAADGIHVVNADGTGDHRLRGTTDDDNNPAWSPDGSRIAVDTDGALAVIDVATGRRELLTNGGDGPLTRAEVPRWTPDGSRIIFDSSDGYQSWRLWTVRPDGTGLHLLVGDRDGFYAAYSTGGTLAYTGFDDASKNTIFIWRDGRPVPLKTPDDSWMPAWSPDATTIAFVSEPSAGGDRTAEVHVIGADGSGERTLTRNRFWDGDPVFSPDGAHIAYDTGRWGWLEIAVMNADGSYKRRLTRELHGDACCPDWRP